MEHQADRAAERLPASIPTSRHVGPVAQGPLPVPLRHQMEQHFGHDFSAVQVHTDTIAADSARAAGAEAYTLGNKIVFDAGRFAPDTRQGMRLLAHELTHVVQQSRTTPMLQRKPFGAPDKAGEQAAFGVGRLRAPVLATLDNFDHGRFTLKPEHDEQLRTLARLYTAIATASPGTTLVLTGHTDLTGDEEINVTLGRQRAVEVAAALARLGVPTEFVRIESEGARQPVVDTPDREPRNRRVEARFEPIASAFQPPERPRFNPFDTGKVTVTLPPPRAPIVTAPSPVPAKPAGAPSQPLGKDVAPRAGTAGDIVKALIAIPVVKAKLDEVKSMASSDLAKLKPGEKVATAAVAGSIAAGAVAGVISDPEARRTALDAIDGLKVAVPGVDGLSVEVKTKDPGGVITIDILKLFGGR
jgi:outer membrane protein OmpA-like peptidoglycan-associated protein